MIDLLFAGESSFVVFEMFVIEVRFGEMKEEDQVNDVSQANAATTPQFSAETKQNTFKKQVVIFRIISYINNHIMSSTLLRPISDRL